MKKAHGFFNTFSWGFHEKEICSAFVLIRNMRDFSAIKCYRAWDRSCHFLDTVFASAHENLNQLMKLQQCNYFKSDVWEWWNCTLVKKHSVMQRMSAVKCEPCVLFSQTSCSNIIGLAVELFVCSTSQITHITRNVLALGNLAPIQARKPLKLD